MDAYSSMPAADSSGLRIIRWAFRQSDKHFVRLLKVITPTTAVTICAFVPLWAYCISILGMQHDISVIYASVIMQIIWAVLMFMGWIYLFNITHPSSQRLSLWKFTMEVAMPLIWEGIKVFLAIIMYAIVPFIILSIPIGLIILVSGLEIMKHPLMLVIEGGILVICSVIVSVKMVRYYFTMLVVLFNRSYKSGRISALKHSAKLSRGLGWWIYFLQMVLPGMILQIPMSFIAEIIMDLFSINSMWSISIVLSVLTYLVFIPIIYLLAVFYFAYVVKDRDQMIGADAF